jgi:hypothetical protein
MGNTITFSSNSEQCAAIHAVLKSRFPEHIIGVRLNILNETRGNILITLQEEEQDPTHMVYSIALDRPVEIADVIEYVQLFHSQLVEPFEHLTLHLSSSDSPTWSNDPPPPNA